MMRMIIVAFLLLPLAARAQLAMFAMNGSTEVAIGATVDMGKVAAGDLASVRIRLRNTGTSKIDITRLFISGEGFTLDRPSLPFPIAAASLIDVELSFSGTTLGPHSATLQTEFRSGTVLTSIDRNATITVVVGPVLTVFPACTGSNGPPQAIDFGRVQSGQLALCTFYLMNPSAQELTISAFGITSISGSAFQLSSGPAAPFKIAAGATAVFVITFTPKTAAVYTSLLTIETRTYQLTGTAFDAPLPKPLLEFDSGPVQSSQQRRLTMRLPTAAAISASGSVKVTFLPDNTIVADDPAVQFVATGTRTLPFTILQGSTQISINGQTSALFQTGTSAGRIRFTLSGIATDGDATTLMTVPATQVTLETAIASRRTGNLDIQVTGFDNTYSAGAMTFTFVDASGQALPTGTIRADFTQDFRTFFTKAQAGSAFQVHLVFPVTGDTSGIGSVDVQWTNSAGVKTQHLQFP